MLFKKMKSLKGIIILLVLIPLVFPTSSVLGYKYDRAKAANWAARNALIKIPNDGIAERRCSSDCTCFASSSLYIGGWKKMSGWFWSANYWWKRSIIWPYQSYAWAKSNYLSTFIENRERGKKIKITASDLSKLVKLGLLKRGDIVQFTKTDEDTKQHSMVVTKVGKNGKNIKCKVECRTLNKKICENRGGKSPVCVSYHSADVKNASLKKLMTKKDIGLTNKDFYLHHLYEYYSE